jgi:Fe-S cluster biogenesis protein NfuA
MSEIQNHNHQTDVPPDVELVEFDGDIVKVKLGGACEGCELSEGTLRGWVEGSVRQFFPHIKRVESVE